MSTSAVAPELLLEVGLRVSAELGRAKMPLASAVGLSAGTIVELDRQHDQPLDLYVNGRHFGTARLLVVDGEWAVRIETINDVESLPAPVAVLHPLTEAPISAISVEEVSSVGQAPVSAADQTD